MSKWLNTTIIRHPKKGNLKKFYDWLHKNNRPCHFCGYCPYGQLVEEFPLKEKSAYSCKVFGHDCPVYYHAEAMAEVFHEGKWVGYVESITKKKER